MTDMTDTTGESGVTTVYDRFTALAKRAIVAARDVADSLGHDFIGTEHLLLGVLAQEDGASRVLGALGVGREALRSSVLDRTASS